MTEKRDRLKESTQETAESQIQGWLPSLPHLARVNEAARKHRELKFTNLLHHIDIAALERAFRRQRASASAGIDGVTVKAYRQDLESNLQALHERIHSGNYWPRPVRRTYIPKSDGGKRPLGIPALEDKIVQSAVAELLSAIYEVDFVDFSWGFRPKRGAHSALEQLSWGIKASKTNWILDVDVSKY
jgi:retron-type reverse transcriptase